MASIIRPRERDRHLKPRPFYTTETITDKIELVNHTRHYIYRRILERSSERRATQRTVYHPDSTALLRNRANSYMLIYTHMLPNTRLVPFEHYNQPHDGPPDLASIPPKICDANVTKTERKSGPKSACDNYFIQHWREPIIVDEPPAGHSYTRSRIVDLPTPCRKGEDRPCSSSGPYARPHESNGTPDGPETIGVDKDVPHIQSNFPTTCLASLLTFHSLAASQPLSSNPSPLPLPSRPHIQSISQHPASPLSSLSTHSLSLNLKSLLLFLFPRSLTKTSLIFNLISQPPPRLSPLTFHSLAVFSLSSNPLLFLLPRLFNRRPYIQSNFPTTCLALSSLSTHSLSLNLLLKSLLLFSSSSLYPHNPILLSISPSGEERVRSNNELTRGGDVCP
ncbi:hypothetical protein C7M84_001692 [Penaeus vannamei]|uniref:Uncharacterized protein n=1 Tax=Penaeus vannamei TaxID=6689 RepID=A0A3R7SX72_PENVA|nr:hypothetical protein C7M84_001692 [Penaeus vannamei]